MSFIKYNVKFYSKAASAWLRPHKRHPISQLQWWRIFKRISHAITQLNFIMILDSNRSCDGIYGDTCMSTRYPPTKGISIEFEFRWNFSWPSTTKTDFIIMTIPKVTQLSRYAQNLVVVRLMLEKIQTHVLLFNKMFHLIPNPSVRQAPGFRSLLRMTSFLEASGCPNAIIKVNKLRTE